MGLRRRLPLRFREEPWFVELFLDRLREELTIHRKAWTKRGEETSCSLKEDQVESLIAYTDLYLFLINPGIYPLSAGTHSASGGIVGIFCTLYIIMRGYYWTYISIQQNQRFHRTVTGASCTYTDLAENLHLQARLSSNYKRATRFTKVIIPRIIVMIFLSYSEVTIARATANPILDELNL